jgi:Tfp pilus assembly protein PilV
MKYEIKKFKKLSINRQLRNHIQRGQSILEVIVAMAIFSLISAAMISMVVGSFAGLTQGGEQTQAEALAQEGVEAVKAIYDEAWNRLVYATSSVSVSGGKWVLDGEGTTETIGQFTRTISFTDVCRDALDAIIACPGNYKDAHSKKVTASVTWDTRDNVSNTVVRSAYITNWDSREWTQTNWSGGAGQTQWSDATRYDTGTNVSHSTAGQLQLAPAADGAWTLSGGTTVTDTNDTNFNQGTYSSTQVTGSGSAAGVILTQSLSWTEHANSDFITQDINSIATTTANNIWGAADSGKIIYYNGTSWTEIIDFGGNDVLGIYMVSSTDGWAAGASGKIWHYNGSWSEHTDTGTETWNDIICTSASNCWAVGNSGALAQYNGTSWTESTIPSSANINAIYALSSSDIWAVGRSGKIWHYNGSWQTPTIVGSDTWNDIICTSASNCWAVGNNGVLAQYNGTSWTGSTISPTDDIFGIYALSDSSIWAAGANGNIWKYASGSWTLHTNTGGERWNDLYFVNANDGFAVGDSGVIRRWLGTSWNSFTSPTSRDLNAISMVNFQSGWSVGDNGTILRFSRDALYEASGVATSSAFNMSNISPVQAIEWSETIPVCSPACDITVDISTAPNSGGSPGAWIGWQNVTIPKGTLLPTILNGNQWVRYRVNLTGDGINTPVLTEIRVNYK